MSPINCKGKLYDGEHCSREVVTGSDWCIFHYPEKTGELSKIFKNEFIEEIVKQEEQHPEYFDFTEFDFPITYEFFTDFKCNVYFNSAIFRKEVTFKLIFHKDVWFTDVQFQESAWFPGVDFLGNADFTNTIFQGDAVFGYSNFSAFLKFGNAKFNGWAIFSEATFKGETWFGFNTFNKAADYDGAVFKEIVSFDETIFNESAGFLKTTFNEDTSFHGTKFSRHVSFTWAEFKKIVDFSESTFQGGASFYRSHFQGDVFFNDVVISNSISFSQFTFEKRFEIKAIKWLLPKLKITNPKVFLFTITDPLVSENSKLLVSGNLGIQTETQIAGISFSNTKLDKVEFVDEIWLRKNRKQKERKIIIDEILLEKKYDLEEDYYSLTPVQVAFTYKRLRENFEKAKRYTEAGDFFIGEMEIRRKYEPLLVNRILLNTYFILAKYGESVSLPFLWFFLSLITIGEYRCLLVTQPSTNRFFLEWLNGIVITFKALLPFYNIKSELDGIVRLWGGLLLGLLIISLRRKLERR